MQTVKPLDGDHCMLRCDIVLRFSPSRSVPPEEKTPRRSVMYIKAPGIEGRIAPFGKKRGIHCWCASSSLWHHRSESEHTCG